MRLARRTIATVRVAYAVAAAPWVYPRFILFHFLLISFSFCAADTVCVFQSEVPPVCQGSVAYMEEFVGVATRLPLADENSHASIASTMLDMCTEQRISGSSGVLVVSCDVSLTRFRPVIFQPM
jgi:hypothetical protein